MAGKAHDALEGKSDKQKKYKEHFKDTMKSKGVDPENIGAHDKKKVKGAFKSVAKGWNAGNAPGKAGKTAHVLGIYKEAFDQKNANVLRSVIEKTAPNLHKRLVALGATAGKVIPKGGFLAAGKK